MTRRNLFSMLIGLPVVGPIIGKLTVHAAVKAELQDRTLYITPSMGWRQIQTIKSSPFATAYDCGFESGYWGANKYLSDDENSGRCFTGTEADEWRLGKRDGKFRKAVRDEKYEILAARARRERYSNVGIIHHAERFPHL